MISNYRLNVLDLTLPPLRERGGDIALLAQAFLDEFQIGQGKPKICFSEEAKGLLEQQIWQGNIRELA